MIRMAEDVDTTSSVPVWVQVAQIIRGRILSGKIPGNTAVPSQKELTSRWEISRGTVAKALVQLQDEGFVFNVPGKGLYAAMPADRERLRQQRVSRRLMTTAPVTDGVVRGELTEDPGARR
jgi:DNA-binding GntR family transcriptional regulator